MLFPAVHVLETMESPTVPTNRTSLAKVRVGDASISPRFAIAFTAPVLGLTCQRLGCEVPHALRLVIQTTL